MAREDLIKALREGSCSDQELNEIRSWLSKPENREEADALFKTIWKESSGDQPVLNFDQDALLQGIMDKVRPVEKKQYSNKKLADREPYPLPKRRGIPLLAKVGAGLALVLTIGYFAIPKQNTSPLESISQVTRQAPRGFRNTITLADGSVAVLNSESTIRYSENYGLKDRVIHLTGEAFFDVAHDPQKPFVVIADKLKTTALGTSFNVNAYNTEKQAISLATGKVKVEMTDPTMGDKKLEMVLTPGQQAVWNESTASLDKKPFNFEEILSWKDNIIYFRNTDLKSMIKVLEKWYDVEITINGETDKLEQPGTGTFKNESLESVLSALGYAMGFEYEMNEEKITLNLTND